MRRPSLDGKLSVLGPDGAGRRGDAAGRRPRAGRAVMLFANGQELRGRAAALRLTETEIERPKLDLLVRVRLPVDVSLQSIRIVGLEDRNPREVLEHDLGHLRVDLAPEAFIEAESRRVAELLEPGLPPVLVDRAGSEQTPHHAVRIA